MVSKIKLYSKLDNLEADLVERLVPHLERAAEGKNDLVFCVKGYHQFDQLKSITDPVTAELVDVGAEILTLKQKLKEPIDGSVAERICWYCREWGNTNNHHRQNAQELAKQFLDEINAQE